MVDGLDIVAGGIQHEGGVIAGVIGPFARPAIVGAAIREGRLVEGLDLGLAARFEDYSDFAAALSVEETNSSSAQK